MILVLALTTVLAADEEVVVDQQFEDQRLYRISATLLGGGLGIAVPLLAGVALQTLETPCAGFGCSTDRAMAPMVALLPGTFAVGIGVAHHARGGKAGAGFGLAGALAGYMSAVSALGILSALSRSDWALTYPGPGAGFIAALSLLCAVGSMELRHSELEAGAVEWRLGRGLAESTVFWLAAAPLEAAFTFAAFATGSGSGTILLMTLGTAITLVGASAAAWGVHRGMDGRGKFWPVVVGAVAAAALGGAFIVLHGYAPPAGGIFGGPSFSFTTFPIAAFGYLIAAAGPAVALEWSNALNSGEAELYREKKESVDFQVRGGFGPGGGSIGLSGTF